MRCIFGQKWLCNVVTTRNELKNIEKSVCAGLSLIIISGYQSCTAFLCTIAKRAVQNTDIDS